MSCIETILTRLSPSLTQMEQSAIKKDNYTHLLESVVAIYEAKVTRYLDMCGPLVRKEIAAQYPAEILDAAVVERTAQCGYSLLLEEGGFSLLASFLYFLKREDGVGLIPLGLRSFYKEGAVYFQFKDLTISVFKSYMARRRLFNELGGELLKEWVSQVEGDSADYPMYLVQAFIIQNIVGQSFAAARQAGGSKPRSLARCIQQTKQPVQTALYGILRYLGSILKGSKIQPDLKQRFFPHLDDQDEFLTVALAPSGAYGERSSEKMHSQIFADHEKVLKSEIGAVCLLGTSLLGCQVTVHILGEEEIEKQRKKEIEALDEGEGQRMEQIQREGQSRRDAANRQFKTPKPSRNVTIFLGYSHNF